MDSELLIQLPPRTRNLLCRQYYKALDRLPPWKLKSLTFPATRMSFGFRGLEMPDLDSTIEVTGSEWLLKFMKTSRPNIRSVTFWRNSTSQWRIRVRFDRESPPHEDDEEDDYQLRHCVGELFRATRTNQATTTILEALAKKGVHISPTRLRVFMYETFKIYPRTVRLADGKRATGYSTMVLPVVDEWHALNQAEAVRKQQLADEAARHQAAELDELVALADEWLLPMRLARPLALAAAGEQPLPPHYADAIRAEIRRKEAKAAAA
jgi:hypothetical protein